MLSDTLKPLPSDRAIRLRNEVCPYCGGNLTPETVTKEHVIGRRFVPRGKLDGRWNLIVNACRPCNERKSDLEDDISAISLHPNLAGIHPEYGSDVIEDLRRKAKNAVSRRTKKPVQESLEQFKFNVPLGSEANFTFTFTSPPRIDERRAFDLARLQLAGFFCKLTYDQAQERGYW